MKALAKRMEVFMKYLEEQCPILSKIEIAPGIYDVTLKAPGIAALASSGQFVNVLCETFTLRRPISICGFDKEKGTLRLVFEVRGEGTKWMSQSTEGEKFSVVGPLGRGFDVKDPSQKAVFVGGGIGVPPLLEAAKAYGENATVIVGFRTASASILVDDFKKNGNHVQLATDDGSAGHHGFVTQLLQKHLDENPCDVIYACGPTPMLKAVADEAEKRGVFCKVSMEQRMACGVGACMVCVCKTLTPKGDDRYAQVCKNGPVFNAKEVVWNG